MEQVLIKLAAAVGLIALNFAGISLAQYFRTMVFLDAVGTAMAGMKYGPLDGFLVGLATNLVIGWLLFRPFLYFAPINALCGIVWGYIGIYFPVPTGADIQLILYILVV